MPTDLSVLRARVENAAKVLGRCWPLQSYIAANPLAGLEKLPFDEAVAQGEVLYEGRGYPNVAQLRAAWETGEIDAAHLADRLKAHGLTDAPAHLLDRMETAADTPAPDRSGDGPLNRAMAKWLAAFVDQGQATWAMPHRQEGFYTAWRAVAPYDTTLAHRDRLRDLPKRPLEALALALSDVETAQWETTLQYHLTALPGWASFIKWRSQDQHDAWQGAHPITMTGYLAARLHTARAIGQPVAPANLFDEALGATRNGRGRPPLAAPWLEAWEATYREQLLANLDGAASTVDTAGVSGRPNAQLVFCIDVRSEVVRRHLEQTGPYQTFGYAGFFGLPMQFRPYGGDTQITSCPPIVDPKHRIHETRSHTRQEAAATHDRWVALGQAGQRLIKSLKHNVAAAFGFVEASGGLFGMAMAARTLMPGWLRTQQQAWTQHVPAPDTFCDLSLGREPAADQPDGLPLGLSTEERSYYAEAAFRLMGWQQFAPVVVFTGHASQTTNNPYHSSLDCGACAGHPGGPNARTLAAVCNDPAVREELSARGIDIPDDTVFLAAEHTTSTDVVQLFHPPELTEAQAGIVEQLRQDLGTARANTTAERARALQGSRPAHAVADTERRAADWAETRPEWGLAGNAAFIIAPRALTAGLSLDGRAFLHAYNWQTDDRGTALETIMTGPLVVGEWINMQYYFSTVDNAVYGSGSKITQNVIGNVGVWQGNGGDLMTGLPLQSLQVDDLTAYHRPLRLLAVVYAPQARVSRIVERNAQLRSLFDHEWMALTVLDPEQGNRRCSYQPGGTWAVPSDEPRGNQDTEPTLAL